MRSGEILQELPTMIQESWPWDKTISCSSQFSLRDSKLVFLSSFHSSEETYLIWESVEHYKSGNTKFHYTKCLYDIWGV